jgi:hypothetical protein
MSIQALNISESLSILPILKIDKIAITRPAPRGLHFTSERVGEIFHQKTIPNLSIKSNSHHRINATFDVPFQSISKNTVHFQASRYRRQHGSYYYRLEFNPNNVGRDGVTGIQDFISKVLCEEDAAVFLPLGRVTRLDIAIDIPGLLLGDVIVRLKSTRKHGVYTSTTGLPETVYLGGSRSNRATAYEKETSFGGQPSLRIERRLKPGVSVADLKSFPTPFKNVVVVPTSPLRPLITEIHPDILFDSMRVRSIL